MASKHVETLIEQPKGEEIKHDWLWKRMGAWFNDTGMPFFPVSGSARAKRWRGRLHMAGRLGWNCMRLYSTDGQTLSSPRQVPRLSVSITWPCPATVHMSRRSSGARSAGRSVRLWGAPWRPRRMERIGGWSCSSGMAACNSYVSLSSAGPVILAGPIFLANVRTGGTRSQDI